MAELKKSELRDARAFMIASTLLYSVAVNLFPINLHMIFTKEVHLFIHQSLVHIFAFAGLGYNTWVWIEEGFLNG